MAESAPMIQYRDELIAGFEQTVSMFELAATTEYMQNGHQAVFCVNDSGNAEAVTRGINGLIPGRGDNNTQYTCQLQEWHDLVTKTGFNIFESQGNQRAAMQRTSTGVIKRKIDDLCIAQLSTATQDTGAAATATISMVERGMTILGRADVPIEEEDNMFCALSPSARGYLKESPQFSSGDYVDVKMFNGASKKMWRWNGCNYFISNRLSGIGTASEKLIMFHRNALGYAAKKDNLNVGVGYDDKQDQYYCRTTLYGGAKILDPSGVVLMIHDGSGAEAE